MIHSLDTETIQSLRTRIRHRLNQKAVELSSKEHSFLTQLEDDTLRNGHTLTDKQAQWLLSVLERTE